MEGRKKEKARKKERKKKIERKKEIERKKKSKKERTPCERTNGQRDGQPTRTDAERKDKK